jgi:dTDP-4-dehydrorhamnose reductase
VKLLVTGRQGQVARSLAERGNGYPDLELRFIGRPEVDLAEPGALARTIDRERPDVVINAAAYTDVDRAEDEPELALRVNADAAGEAAQAAAQIGAIVVQISTDYVFDGRSGRPYREDDSLKPLNVYGASKAAGEERVRSANAQHMILRTSWVISPFGRNFVRTIMGAARSRDLLAVVDDQLGRPTSALDFADAILTIASGWTGTDRRGLGQTLHVAGTGTATWFGLAREVMDECRRIGAASADVRPISSSEWPTRAVRPGYSVLDCTRFERDFGQVLPDWQTSAAAIVRSIAESDENPRAIKHAS